MASGIATIGTLVGYAFEEKVGVKPIDFTRLNRVNTVGGIQIDRENISASAMEDGATMYVVGRTDTGDNFPVNINLTSVTQAEWERVFQIYRNRENKDLGMWLEVWNPYMDEAFYLVVVPPVEFSIPEIAQSSVLITEINLGVSEYVGMGKPIKPMPPFYLLMNEEDAVLSDESGNDLFAYIEIEEEMR